MFVGFFCTYIKWSIHILTAVVRLTFKIICAKFQCLFYHLFVKVLQKAPCKIRQPLSHVQAYYYYLPYHGVCVASCTLNVTSVATSLPCHSCISIGKLLPEVNLSVPTTTSLCVIHLKRPAIIED